MPNMESEKESMESDNGLNAQESGRETGNAAKKPEANDLQKLMKERFGDAKFGTLMNSIVDEMFKNMAEVAPTYGGAEGVEVSGGNKREKADKTDKTDKADKAKKADQADPIGE